MESIRKRLTDFIFSRLQEIQFDLSNFCNLRCPMCYMAYHRFNKQEFLDFKLYQKTLLDLARNDYHVDMIKLYWIGEPLLHPDFLKMVDYAYQLKRKGEFFRHLMVSTNGLLWRRFFTDNFFHILTKEENSHFRQDTFLVIVFSLDSVNPVTYKKVKPGGEVEQVIENIVYFLKKRKSLGFNFPIVTLQFVVQEENYQELNDFISFWQRIFSRLNLPLEVYYSWWHNNNVDHIAIQPQTAHVSPKKQQYLYQLYLDAISSYQKQELDPFGDYSNRFRKRFELEEKLPQKKKDRDYRGDNDRQPCNSIFFAPNIKSTGEVAICCRQALSKDNIVGNLKEDSLLNIWTGDKIEKYRQEQIRGIFCCGCEECYSQEQWGYLTREIVEEYCDILRDKNLKEIYLKRIGQNLSNE